MRIHLARREIEADGHIREVTFDVPIMISSRIALRILPSSRTNPVFVQVGGKPIRASKKSPVWCLAGVDRCWCQKGAGDPVRREGRGSQSLRCGMRGVSEDPR